MFGTRARRLARRVADLEAAAGSPNLPAPTTTVTPGPPLGGGWWWTSSERQAAMSVPTLAYIRGQMAGGLSAMPLERYRQSTDPNTGQITTTKLAPGWCARPDPAPTIPPSVFWAWVIDDLFFQGQSTLVVLGRDADGFPVMFRRVVPGQVIYSPEMLALGTWWPSPITYMGIEVAPEDQILIAGPHEGICNYGGQTIQAALDLETNAAQSASEPLPNIDLHQTAGEPISTTAAQDLVDSWKTARRAGATAYTPQNLEARPLGFSAADQQMTEARQYMATQLARMAGVNPVLVSAAMGSASSYVYTNQADYRRAFLDDVLDAYLRAIEGRLSANDVTPRGQFLEFDRDAFTTLPLLERAQVMVGALRSGAAPELVNQLADALDLDLELPTGPAAADTQPQPISPAPAPPPAVTPTPATTAPGG
jgi:Phage portal protein